MNTDRLPPFSLESEQGVLGCCLLDPRDTLAECIARGIGDQFYDLRHATLFEVIAAMQDANKPLDTITLCEELKQRKQLEAVGGYVYISSLSDSTPAPSNIDCYLAKMEEKFYARQVIAKGGELITTAYDDSLRLPELVDKTETEIFALRRMAGTSAGTRKESFRRIIQTVGNAHEAKGQNLGVQTGFIDLDRILGGLRYGSMITLAARPSMGKSSLAMNIAEKVSTERQIPVGFFSLEMPEDELNLRSIGSYACVDMKKIMAGDMDEQEMPKLLPAAARLEKAPIHIRDRSDLRISQLRAEGRRMVSQHGVKLIIVDYMQLITGTRRFDKRNDEVAEVSRGIKQMALELKIPVLALAQLNREIEKGNKRRPKLSDLRDSGSIEQDSDVVLFIHCEDETQENSQGEIPVEILIAKNRAGATGMIKMLFRKQFTRFENYCGGPRYAVD
jgi:replicative DNA helicase